MARMTGAGFGGCAVALVNENNAQTFLEAVSELYKERSGFDADVYICKASDGASPLKKK